MCLLANTSNDKPAHLNKSLICLPMKEKGIHLAKKIDKMGMRCSDTAVIYFEDVRVPAKNIIGQEGYGFTYQMLQFQQERLACAALSLMPLERCISDTIEYTKTRKAFGIIAKCMGTLPKVQKKKVEKKVSEKVEEPLRNAEKVVFNP